MELEALDDVEVKDTETPDNNVEGFKTPTIGIYFETIEEARNYYERYGQENGFWIRTRGSDKGQNRSNEVTRVRFVCTKEGNYAAKKQQEGVQSLNVDAVDEEEKVISRKKRSEGINSFFDGFVTHTSNLKEFVVKYEKALSRIVKRKNDEDFESEYKFRIVNDHEFLLKHAGKMYTRNVFNKFKDEWSKEFHYKVENVRNDDGFQSFVVKSKDDELEKFEVTLDSQTYEGLVLDDNKEESEALRLSHTCQEAIKLAFLAAPSNEAFKNFIEGMNDLFEKIQEVSKVSPIEICAEKDIEKSTKPSPSHMLLLDPNISICKDLEEEAKGLDSDQKEGSDSDQEEGLDCSE
ncbi:hypothetical protein RHSIM_Rhsim11G0010300 [Rhododendron simsii]|uniref:Protein FAR1-RELATED SEQUENCE n=1 Tax=Rhododendron simsii TaxID=118357 RepID=A0A834LAR0_RHOSS|nr:hypothetical protein RHSIM_Rhsim11G0010300 [Rhododendron simsii]